jgi:hypothetical protein
MKKLSTILTLLIFCSVVLVGQTKSNETKIDALLKQMTIEEKSVQMTQQTQCRHNCRNDISEQRLIEDRLRHFGKAAEKFVCLSQKQANNLTIHEKLHQRIT